MIPEIGFEKFDHWRAFFTMEDLVRPATDAAKNQSALQGLASIVKATHGISSDLMPWQSFLPGAERPKSSTEMTPEEYFKAVS